jgi:hypothetical protein
MQLAQVCEVWGQPALAEVVYQRVINSGDVEGGPIAALGLGFLYESRKAKGNVARARALYQRVIDSQHPAASPIAARRLASLNRRTGFGQARRRRSIPSGQGRR